MTGFGAPVLVLPTGAGKTVVFAFIAYSSASRGKKVLILVHRIELLRQTQKKLQEFGIRAGLISPKYTPDYGAQVQVAMVQTLVGRVQYYSTFDLIITDECHHVGADTYLKILNQYQCYQLGVTATPIRSDGKGLGKGHGGVYDHMVLGPSTRKLMDMGHLVEMEVYLPPSDFDRAELKRSGKDYSKKQAFEKTAKRSITGNACDHYLSFAKYEPGVVFCINVDHAKMVAQEYRDNGIKAFCVDGGMDDRERNRLLNGLGDGSIHVITSCDVISEGTDIPNITTGQSLRPTESLGLHLQQMGRPLRTAPGKTKAKWFDHVGNVANYNRGELFLNHGFPDDDREWSLEGEISTKRSNEEIERITLCDSCFMAYKASQKVCPHCGSTRAVKASNRSLAQRDAELVRVEKEQVLAMQKQKRREVGAARTLEELEQIAIDRGYKAGWVPKMAKLKGIS